MTKEEYLNTLKDQIRDKHAKEFVCEEYKTHIEDQIDAYVNDGMNNEQATQNSFLSIRFLFSCCY